MAFIFSTSHLPETRVRRPDHLEDEEEEDVMQPMPRAGGVRAFSHLPQPVRAQADFDGPLSTRPATPVGRPRPHTEPDDDQDTGHAPAPDSDHDDDTRPHDEYADDTLWHSPRISTQDQPPPYRHEDEYAQEEREHSDPSTLRSSGFPPSPQDLRDAFHSPAPDSPTREAPAQDNASALPQGLPFGRHLPSGLRDQRTNQPRNFAGKAEYHDLVYRPRSNPEEQDHREGFFQNAADTRASRPAPSGPLAPQTYAQNARPAAQAPASKQAPVQGTAPQTPAANGQTPKQHLMPEDMEEIHPTDGEDKGLERKPLGQLGIRGGEGFAKDGRPKTVCLYDGSEFRTKAIYGKDSADAISLQRAAREYASREEWMIDISQPGWEKKLKAIQRKLEGEGTANDPHKGIDRIMVFDHAGTGRHEFGSTINPTNKQRVGNYLTPNSSAWKTITSSIKPQGDIVLTGCETAKTDWDETGKEDVIMPNSGPRYLEDLYYAADASRTPTIHAYDRNVRHRTYLGRLSLTAGRQHSLSTEGYQVVGPEDLSGRARRRRRRIKNKAAKKAEP